MPAPQSPPPPRLDQASLDDQVRKHALFRAGRIGGMRASLAHQDLTRLSVAGKDLAHADLTGALLYGADLTEACLDYAVLFTADLREANLTRTSLVRADLRGANLRGTQLFEADLTGADLREGSVMSSGPLPQGHTAAMASPATRGGHTDFRGANLTAAKLSGAVAIATDFKDANLKGAKLVRANLREANLSGANLQGADMSLADLRAASLKNAILVDAEMTMADLQGADLAGALTRTPLGPTLADQTFDLAELLQRHRAWVETRGAKGERLSLKGHDWRGTPALRQACLSMLEATAAVFYGLDLTGAELQAAQFASADLRTAVLHDADARGAAFAGAQLQYLQARRIKLSPLALPEGRQLKTDAQDSSLRYADLSGGDLRDVNFTRCDLSYADLSQCDLRGAIFTGAVLVGTRLDDDAPVKAQKER